MERTPLKASFDLLDNAFVLLDVTPSATNKEILDAFEDAVADNPSNERALTDARQTLLNPRLRIEAELSTLIDTPEAETRSLIGRLRVEPSHIDLQQAISQLAPLSRCNLLAHLSAQGGPDAGSLVAFIDCQSRIDPEKVLSTLVRVRTSAGIIKPDPDIVRNSLYRLAEIQAEAIFAGYEDSSVAAKDATSCATRVLVRPEVAKLDALERLLRGYRQRVQGELANVQRTIDTSSEQLRRNPSNAKALDDLLQGLKLWDLFGQPLQILEAYKGRDEIESRSVFEEIRLLSINIANDQNRLDVALKIAKASAAAFSKLPRAADQLSEDIKVLEESVAASGAEHLRSLLVDLDGKLKTLAADLRATGFSAASKGLAAGVFKAFCESVSSTRNTAASPLPWALMRNLAIQLNNEADEHLAARALLDGLLSFAKNQSPTDVVLERLSEDREAIQRTLLEQSLAESLKSNRTNKSLSTIGKLLLIVRSEDEQNTLRGIRAHLEKKRNVSYVRWAVLGIIGCIAVFGVLSNKTPTYPPYTDNYAPTRSQTLAGPTSQNTGQAIIESATPAQSVADTVEDMPSVGSNLQFTRGNIRYCLFQRQRLEFARTLLANYSVPDFNKAVDDWNSRCSSYQYLKSDQSDVELEVLAKQAKLEADARALATRWAMTQVPPSTAAPSGESARRDAGNDATAERRPPPVDLSSNAGQATTPPQSPLLNPLKIEDAIRLQRRLAELGFFKGPANGTWGPITRLALRSFKMANGLPDDDKLDELTSNKLSSNEAVHWSPAVRAPNLPIDEATYPPPEGSTLNPLNKVDAIRIHHRLRELGFYNGKNDTIWSGASRLALRDFKIRHGLLPDDIWDGMTEKRLFDHSLP